VTIPTGKQLTCTTGACDFAIHVHGLAGLFIDLAIICVSPISDFGHRVTNNIEWYDPAQVKTTGGSLRIDLDERINHNMNYAGGMLSTWNKFCFTEGYVEGDLIGSLRLTAANKDICSQYLASRSLQCLWPLAGILADGQPWTRGLRRISRGNMALHL
jgi:hypothetical protein